MGSSLAWIDHDPHERERVTRILALFTERESRDELGLGSIRDSIADTLFPGTSTIQTRLRYMLFVPWVYRELERNRVPAAEVARRARKAETELVAPLLSKEEEGILGRRAKGDLKRLPSSVYWAGLGAWGIRVYGGDQDHYHRSFDRITQRRSVARRRDDLDIHDEPILTWHPQLPEPPDRFPEGVTFDLRLEEAEFIRDRILERHPDTLLAWLVRDEQAAPQVDQIWNHPQLSRFAAGHQEVVHHASLFSEVMFGAALLYNLQLAELRQEKERVAEYNEAIAQWVNGLASDRWRQHLRDWQLERFWQLVVGPDHSITELARRFVEAWTGCARGGTVGSVSSEPARQLVRQRERLLKRGQSRFDNRRALDQWSGHAGVFRANYRWARTSRLLADLKAGLHAEEAE